MITWADVLRDWEAAEAQRWESVFRERGYNSWWEWRKSYVEQLGLEDREWIEESIDNPHDVIPTLVIGGYRGWKPYRPAGLDVATFADVARPVESGGRSILDEPRIDVRTNETVMSLVGNMNDSTLLVLQSGDLRVLLDGTHRAAATAVEALDGPRSSFVATLRSCQFDASERPLLEAFARDRRATIKKKND